VNADPNLDYLCEGIPDTINNKLSQVSELKKVIARNSVAGYKGKAVDARKVGQDLNVKAVLLTRLARVGDQLTISPILVRTQDNSQLWGERYSRKFGDLLAIEEEMATSIVQALRLKISGEEKLKIFKRSIDNAAAHEFYLKAMYEAGIIGKVLLTVPPNISKKGSMPSAKTPFSMPAWRMFIMNTWMPA
jgi:adenylate cyclase